MVNSRWQLHPQFRSRCCRIDQSAVVPTSPLAPPLGQLHWIASYAMCDGIKPVPMRCLVPYPAKPIVSVPSDPCPTSLDAPRWMRGKLPCWCSRSKPEGMIRPTTAKHEPEPRCGNVRSIVRRAPLDALATAMSDNIPNQRVDTSPGPPTPPPEPGDLCIPLAAPLRTCAR